MESDKIRFKALDGLRGIAILLVFLNHINTIPLIQSLPSFVQPIIIPFISSGRTAVSIFFLLSGFLMAYFYPQVNDKIAFLQKRYTRIFPLFIGAVITRSVLRNIPELPWYIQLIVIFAPAICIHLVWVYGIKKVHSFRLSRILFWLFILVQLVVAGIYIFWIMRQPAIVFNQQTAPPIREGFITLVNATLTLPLGSYIPMLDGVYWSLVAEVFFYILYPFTFAPVAQYIQSKSSKLIILFLFALLPFFLGVDILSRRIMTLSMLEFSYFYYFVLGITGAYLVKNNSHWLKKIDIPLPKPLASWTPLIGLAIILIALHLIYGLVPISWHPLIRIVAAIPFSYIFLLTVLPSGKFAKFLETRWLVFIGTISYSIYLMHTSVVELAKQIYTPDTSGETLIFIIITGIISIAISKVIFNLLEKPYFIKKSGETFKSIPSKQAIPVTKILGTIISIYIFALLLAYQSNVNIFSVEYAYTHETLRQPAQINNPRISLRDNPQVNFEFKARETNLGIITMNLTYQNLPDDKHPLSATMEQKLDFRIKEKGKQAWWSTTSYNPSEIGKSEQHPFGFPVIADSQDKTYEIQLELLHPKLPTFMIINGEASFFKTIHKLEKREVLTSFPRLYSLMSNRLQNVVSNPEAYKVFYLLLPLIIFAIGLHSKKK